MVIVRDTHRFEVTIDELYGEWVAKLQEFVPGRLLPTVHLLRAFDTRPDAIAAVVRKWQVLFPDEPPLVWHEPPAVPARPRPERPRRRFHS
jgi:hypothetical protein